MSDSVGRDDATKLASEMLQQLDLAKSALSQNLLAENIGDLLDGYTFTGLVVGSSTVCVPSSVAILDAERGKCCVGLGRREGM